MMEGNENKINKKIEILKSQFFLNQSNNFLEAKANSVA